MKGKKVHDVLNRLHLAMPAKRDEKVRASSASGGSFCFSWFHFVKEFLLSWFPPGQASVHPRGRHVAQEGDGGGRTQTEAGMFLLSGGFRASCCELFVPVKPSIYSI